MPTSKHLSGYGADPFVLFRLLYKPVGNDAAAGSSPIGRYGSASLPVERSDAVERAGRLLGGKIALALFRHHMHDHRHVIIERPGKNPLHLFDVVTIYGPQILYAQALEELIGHEQSLDGIFHAGKHLFR